MESDVERRRIGDEDGIQNSVNSTTTKMAINLDSNISNFDVTGDVTSIGPRWTRWKRALQYYVVGKGITDPKQKKALLLHTAGMDVQEVFETLADPGVASGVTDTADEYEKTLRTLYRQLFQTTN